MPPSSTIAGRTISGSTRISYVSNANPRAATAQMTHSVRVKDGRARLSGASCEKPMAATAVPRQPTSQMMDA